MRRHAERINIVLLAELSKPKRLVALMAIRDKQPTRHNYLALCMLNKVLQPLNSKLVSHPAIVADGDSPTSWYILRVLGRQVVLAGKDNNGIAQPAALIPWITVAYSRLPG